MFTSDAMALVFRMELLSGSRSKVEATRDRRYAGCLGQRLLQGPECRAKGLRSTEVGSHDPNDKSGTQGVGAAHFVLPAAPLGYAISFENMITATAPAQTVLLTDPLDGSKLDLATFTLGAMRFGDTVVTPPAGRSQFSTEVDLRPAKNLLVQIEAGLDRAVRRRHLALHVARPGDAQLARGSAGGPPAPQRRSARKARAASSSP